MKRSIKLIIFFSLLILSGFLFYLYKLHSLALEGNKIFEQRCLVVNPPLIAYKNSFLSFADAMKNPTKYKNGEAENFFYDYIDEMRKYVPEETNWLEQNGKYISRWDFQLIEPLYLKKAGDYQQKMYEGYRDDAQLMLEAFDNNGIDDTLQAKFTDAKDRRDKYSQLYFDLYDKAMAISDWRKIFSRVPMPEGCSEDVLVIPSTFGALDTTPAPAREPDITG